MLFVVLAIAIWFAGSRLTYLTDTIAERFNLSSGFVGLIFLSTATSLPEIATILSAAAISLSELAPNNLFVGVAPQTTILAITDLWVRGEITNFPRKTNHALEASFPVFLPSNLHDHLFNQ